MVNYETYVQKGGKLGEYEFNQLEPNVCRLIDAYIKGKVASWNVKPLSEYGIDFSDVICVQVDFIADNGGVTALNGNSDFNVSSVSTKGFTYQLKNKKVPMFNNVPLSPMMLSELNYLLRQAGLLSRCL